jgi:hypothetical protein
MKAVTRRRRNQSMKHEIRNTKSETNLNDGGPKSKTPANDSAQGVWSFGIWSFGVVSDFVLRALIAATPRYEAGNIIDSANAQRK